MSHHISVLSSSLVTYVTLKAMSDPRAQVDVLTAVSGGGDGRHGEPEEAEVEEEAEAAAAGKVVVAAAGVGGTAAAVAAVVDGCAG